MKSSVLLWWLNATLLCGCIVFAVWLLEPISGALLSAWLMAYLLAPLVTRLEQYPMSRNQACLLVYSCALVLISTLVLIFLPPLIREISGFIELLPDAVQSFEVTLWPQLMSFFGFESIAENNNLRDWLKAAMQHLDMEQISPWAAWGSTAVSGFFGFVAALLNLLMVPLVAYYLLHDWDKVTHGVYQRIPKFVREKSRSLFQDIGAMISSFLRGQLSVCCLLAVLYGVGLALLGLPSAFAIGTLAGMLAFIPYLGLLIGLSAAILISFWSFGLDYHLILIVVVFASVQVLESFYLTPKILGDALGLNPVVILLALVIGGEHFGFTGILLAIPVTASASILVRELDLYYQQRIGNI
ncbi:MAG: AI-2E family transporter [Mariprofundaceae bacterium]|nr:AI-2E family transporter [Mariprofundaceae bacterium]